MDVMRVVKQAMSTSEALMAKPVTYMMRAGEKKFSYQSSLDKLLDCLRQVIKVTFH